MAEDRDVLGRFAPGNKGSGRPMGIVNKITKSLREMVIEGIAQSGAAPRARERSPGWRTTSLLPLRRCFPR
jgi:hypothetical protein